MLSQCILTVDFKVENLSLDIKLNYSLKIQCFKAVEDGLFERSRAKYWTELGSPAEEHCRSQEDSRI